MLKGFLALLWEGVVALAELAWWMLGLGRRAAPSLLRRSLKEAFWFLAGLTGTLLLRTLPERTPKHSRRQRYVRRILQARETQPRGHPFFIALGLVAPLLGVALVAYGYLQLKAFQARRFEGLLTQAQTRLEEARQSGPGAEKLLLEAEKAALAARRIRPQDQKAKALEEEAKDRLDELLGIERLYFLPHLKKLSDAPLLWGRIYAQGREIYLLETGATSRLWKLALNEAGDALDPKAGAEILLAQGMELEGRPVGELADFLREGEGLMALEATGRLYRLQPGKKPEASPLEKLGGQPEGWKMAKLGADLLILDAGANRILRYAAGSSGYGPVPSDYLRPETVVNLKEAKDMASDGQSVYVLLADGMVLKFWNGLRVSFEPRGLEAPLKNPTAIYAGSAVGSVYIADTGNQRIVELGKDGAFRREYRPREGMDGFAHLEGLYADVEGRRLYILNGGSLYLGALPQGAGR